jgi:hypothetical protein
MSEQTDYECLSGEMTPEEKAHNIRQYEMLRNTTAEERLASEKKLHQIMIDSQNRVTDDANAAMIRNAAPVLLAACKDSLELFDYLYSNFPKPQQMLSDKCNQLKSAIALAEGK